MMLLKMGGLCGSENSIMKIQRLILNVLTLISYSERNFLSLLFGEKCSIFTNVGFSMK